MRWAQNWTKRFGKDCAKSITNIAIPEGVTKLEYLTFANCSSLIDIVLPSSITYIQQSTFGFKTV